MKTVKRLKYATGQFLTATDFEAEQSYHREQRQRLNQSLFTWGLVAGLGVTKLDDRTLKVAPGVALDAQGREVVLLEEQTLDLAGQPPEARLALTAGYREIQDDADKIKIGGADAWTRVSEQPELKLVPHVTGTPLPGVGGVVLDLAVLTLAAGKLSVIDLGPRKASRPTGAPVLDGKLPLLDVAGDSMLNGKLGVKGAVTFDEAVQFKKAMTLATPLGVGTGAATPLSALTVNANITGVGPGVPGITIGNAGNSFLAIGNDSSNYLTIGWIDPSFARIYAASSKPLVLQEYGGPVGIGTTTPLASKKLHVAGTVQIDGHLQVNGGKNAYVMDQFVNRRGEAVETGDVVVIGKGLIALHYGVNDSIPVPEVDLAGKAYDTRLCGIVCEVHGELRDVEEADGGKKKTTRAKSARAARQQITGFSEEEQKARDMSRVEPGQIGFMVTLGAFAWCKVDADIAPIAAGDLLTTSATAGHAQKVLDRSQAIGAILGKALAPLKKGRGKIPVLVTLQ